MSFRHKEDCRIVVIEQEIEDELVGMETPSAKTTSSLQSSPSPRARTESPIDPDSQTPSSHVGSSLGDENSSRSLTSSIFQYTKENGRTYHKYKEGSYFFPNDPTETDRLDFQYEILKYAFNDRNYFAPIQNPKTILDIGTGTGQWAIEMGDEFPDAEIQATDLSPIQPTSVPENVRFFIDDASENDWCVPLESYDYIHTRVMLGSFEDFKSIIRRSFQYLKPGGYMESQELMSIPYCDDGTMPADWPFLDWSKLLDDAAMQAERPLRIATRLKRWYEDAGFVGVQEKIYKLPVGPWPRDLHLKKLGTMWEDNCLAGLQGFSLAPFSRTLNWSKNEIEVYLVNVRKAISDPHVHAYHKIYVVTGRKPGGSPPTA